MTFRIWRTLYLAELRRDLHGVRESNPVLLSIAGEVSLALNSRFTEIS